MSKTNTYIHRAIEKTLAIVSKNFPVVMICGPRQVGKSTLLEYMLSGKKGIQHISLDNPVLRASARNDPDLFLQQYPAPLVIDEIQYAPELLPYIKIRIDKAKKDGAYFLTGSQMFVMMRNISETLAGRIAILSLYSFSETEIRGVPRSFFLPNLSDAEAVRRTNENPTESETVFQRIFRGGMPRMIVKKEITEDIFFSSYVQTYLERDIRDVLFIKDETRFLRFISCVAARSGQEVVYEDLARAAEVDNKTAQSWLSLLVTTGIVFLLQPYASNITKRIIKRPKLYFMDTGLCCYLAHVNNPKTLQVSQWAGAFFETFVVTQIIKSFASNGMDAHHHLYFYRDNNGKEIDLLISYDNKLYPVEIKLSSDPGKKAARHFSVLSELGAQAGEGAVICMSPHVVPLNEHTRIFPVQVI